MGKRRTRTTQTNRPIFHDEMTGANRNVQDAYTQSQPLINQTSNNMGQVSNDLFAQFREGDPTIQAAQATARELMAGGENPHLQAMIDQTNSSVRNQLQASLGRRGLSGGSDYTNLIARALARNETEARFGDFNAAQQRRLQAAGMAPGLLQGALLPAQMGAQLGVQGAMLPNQAAALQAASTGGLLGQYQDVRGTQVQSGGLLGSILSGAVQAGMGALLGGGG